MLLIVFSCSCHECCSASLKCIFQSRLVAQNKYEGAVAIFKLAFKRVPKLASAWPEATGALTKHKNLSRRLNAREIRPTLEQRSAPQKSHALQVKGKPDKAVRACVGVRGQVKRRCSTCRH